MGECDLCGNGGRIVLYPVPDPTVEDKDFNHVCRLCLRRCCEEAEEVL